MGWLARRRKQQELDSANTALAQLQRYVATQHAVLNPLIAQCRAAIGSVTEQQLNDLVRKREADRRRLGDAEQVMGVASNQLHRIKTTCDELRRKGTATPADLEFVAMCQRRDLPGQYSRRERLRAAQRTQRRARTRLEEQLRELNKRIAKLRRDAEGEIVAEAKVVATTLARSRAHPAVARQQFDVVLVDEAGAAVVGEVLLAVSQASRTATLLGDFLQLGPVTADVDHLKNRAVQKWLMPDGFTQCGIRTSDDVMDNPGCVALFHQFRFGPNLRHLANDVIYRVLEDGVTKVSGRAPENTEIVLVDVRGLSDLNQVQRSGKYAGWWVVGALLSRTLVQHHAVDGMDEVGVVTTFRQQAEATHAALRDSGQNLDVAVGTAHSFQGREFNSVIFDLVEDGNGWIKASKWSGDDFARAGVRLFGVGITRARKRLYIIANGELAVKAAVGDTPLGALRRLGSDGGVHWCRAGVLLGMAEQVEYKAVSSVEAELNEVLRGLVDVTDVHDEFSFDEALHGHLTSARSSLWMWSPWVGRKSRKFLPLLSDAVDRDVDVRVFIRTERDKIMLKESNKHWVEELEATGAKVIRAEVEHRKVVVVDRQVVLLGSHNPLSQYSSREVMITCRGAAFAERMLDELQADVHGNPPVCEQCGRDFELWRSAARKKGTPYFWRCHPCKIDRDVATPKRGRR
jgi:hypothetical protein